MNWHEYSAQAALREFDVTPDAGLKAAQVTERQEKYGKNQLRAAGRRSTLQMFLEQFKDVMVLILLVAAIISGFALKEWTDCIIILLVVVLNAVLGVVQENVLPAREGSAGRRHACGARGGTGARGYCRIGNGRRGAGGSSAD